MLFSSAKKYAGDDAMFQVGKSVTILHRDGSKMGNALLLFCVNLFGFCYQ